MNKLKMTIVMMIGIFFMVGMLGTACAQGSNCLLYTSDAADD